MVGKDQKDEETGLGMPRNHGCETYMANGWEHMVKWL